MAMRPSEIAKDFYPAPSLCEDCACQPVCVGSIYQPDECENFSPKVVQCKNCKKFDTPQCRMSKKWDYPFLGIYPLDTKNDDFCSYGERRSENAAN